MRPEPRQQAGWSRPAPAALEYVWKHDGPRDIHAFVARPIVLQLAAAGAYTVLDLGCGNGWFTAGLGRCGFKVTGVDHSESGLRIAREKNPGLEYLHQDVIAPLRAELIGRFDAVVAIDLVDHVTAPRKMIELALLALKPGGILIVTSPFHGYFKNVALALTDRFDHRWDSLTDHSRVKFFSRSTLLRLMSEFQLHDLHFESIGRIPMFARSMLVSGRAPV